MILTSLSELAPLRWGLAPCLVRILHAGKTEADLLLQISSDMRQFGKHCQLSRQLVSLLGTTICKHCLTDI